mmetsp:Transcript_18467/g.24402  ORF Transcript_18467/g.24402 Transcript_18467/m.24402 type:complete len:342 (-) Transcript_18467:2709-3734(-)
MDLRNLFLAAGTGQLKCMVKCSTVSRIFNRRFNQAKFIQQFGASLSSKRQCPSISHPLGSCRATVNLGYADGFVPHVVGAVHVNSGQPLSGLGVVVLGFPQVPFHLQLLRQELVRLLQQLLPVGRDQPDHGIVLAVVLVHTDSHIDLLHCEVQLLGLLQLPLLLQLLRLTYVQALHFCGRHVRHSQFVSGVPHVDGRVHLHCQLRSVAQDKELLRLPPRFHLFVMASQSAVVWSAGLLVQSLHQLTCLGPLARTESGVDGFPRGICLDVVVDGHVDLFLLHQEISPHFLQHHHLVWEAAPSQFCGALESIPAFVRLQGLGQLTHLLIEFPSTPMHPRRGQC